ncbi:hypothetical protein HYW43_01405 [Candidatus Daviesbacteria bacterium]|nr:hypothetical protein [Candidatus Daviesbacteria bacterium]
MRVAIFSPYLDTFGGGEKYMMTIAEVLSPGNVVDVLLDKHLFNLGGDYLKRELSKRFNLNLKLANFRRKYFLSNGKEKHFTYTVSHHRTTCKKYLG